MRLRFRAALFAVGLLALPNAWGTPATAAALVASSDTTVIADASSSVRFELSRAAEFEVSPGPDSSMTIDGRGRVLVASLRRVGSSKPTEAFVLARFNGCDSPGCSPSEGQAAHLYARSADGQRRSDSGRARLEAGEYRLTVLTDGSPATVNLRFSGQPSPSGTLPVTEPVASSVVLGAETVGIPASPSYWSGGASLRLPVADAVLVGYLQQASPLGTVVGAAGACHFSGPQPLLGHFAPGCPFNPGPSGSAQVGSLSTEQLTLGSAELARMATSLPAAQGNQQVGFWSARAGLTESPYTVFGWVALG